MHLIGLVAIGRAKALTTGHSHDHQKRKRRRGAQPEQTIHQPTPISGMTPVHSDDGTVPF